MGAASLLALMARHSLIPARQHSKLAVSPSQLAEEQPHEPEPAGSLHLLSRFHVDLAERLQQLQLQGTGDAHLNWLLDAFASTLSMHRSLQAAFTVTGAANSAKHRADEVLNMLDVCTALKQVADDMDRQFDCLQHALQSVQQALISDKSLSSGRLCAAAHRLSACLLQERNVFCITVKPLAEARSSVLLAAKRELQSSTTPLDLVATLLGQALDGAMLTSLLVLAAAVSSLAPPSPRKCSGTITGACKMIIKYLGAKSVSTPWATPLRQLHHDLRQDMSKAGGSLFQELQGLHSAATKLHATITAPGAHSIELAAVKQSIECLLKRLREAQSCVSMLRIQLASLFQALVALRLALLDS